MRTAARAFSLQDGRDLAAVYCFFLQDEINSDKIEKMLFLIEIG